MNYLEMSITLETAFIPPLLYPKFKIDNSSHKLENRTEKPNSSPSKFLEASASSKG